jgi:hypothetical protein
VAKKAGAKVKSFSGNPNIKPLKKSKKPDCWRKR